MLQMEQERRPPYQGCWLIKEMHSLQRTNFQIMNEGGEEVRARHTLHRRLRGLHEVTFSAPTFGGRSLRGQTPVDLATFDRNGDRRLVVVRIGCYGGHRRCLREELPHKPR